MNLMRLMKMRSDSSAWSLVLGQNVSSLVGSHLDQLLLSSGTFEC